jgi:hypothetical protein
MTIAKEFEQWMMIKRAHDSSPSVIEQTWIP